VSELFDIERLRRNWTAPAQPVHEAPQRFDDVPPPVDLRTAALVQFARLREHCAQSFPEQRDALDAFLRQIDTKLQQALMEIERPGDQAGDTQASDAATEGDPSKREQLLSCLWQLERLLEVFILSRR
jgi:hypothetical protein